MKQLPLAVAAALLVVASGTQARDHITVVGSSTVYPFTTAVAEAFAKKTGNPAPKVESTGTGGGMKLFCAGVGMDSPDLSNASRRIKQSEYESCKQNGVDGITELQIGYDALTIAQSNRGQAFKDFTLKDLYLGLAKEIPDPSESGGNMGGMMGSVKMIPNPYKNWNEVNAALPAIKIQVLGPPPTSGTRDSFSELGMESGCKRIPAMQALKAKDSKQFEKLCRTVREDGAFIEAGENDNLIVQKLAANPNVLGVFGFSFLDQNTDKLRALSIEGVTPSADAAINKSYPLARAMYVYLKNAHIGQVQGLEEFIAEYTSPAAMGQDGYLVDKGLIPVPANQLAALAATAKARQPLAAKGLK